MATIKPFAAVRPTPAYAQQVAALPYDVMNSDEAREMVKGNPYSFLHVDKAEIDLPTGTNAYDDGVYAKARETLDTLQAEGVLVPDAVPQYYIYSLTMDGREQTGLVATASIDDYLENKIKKHEFTRADKEQDRIRHVDTCSAQTGPIFLTYREVAAVSALLTDWKKTHAPVYSFTTEDGIGHAVWVIDNEDALAALTAYFAAVPSLYIADGHHRTASAVRVGQMRRQQFPPTPSANYNYFLSVLFPADQLYVMDYNRVVKDLNGHSPKELLTALTTTGYIVEPRTAPVRPERAGEFGMYLEGTWYALTAPPAFYSAKNPVEALDVSVLQTTVLTPLLAIGDPRTDTRIDFIGGIRGLNALAQRVDSGEWAVAFSMFPTSIHQVMDIADNDMVMPPKSTWFEPKLRSGLFIHLLEE